MVSRSLLLFTIGPVQPFIAQARKTRDLWMGSFLLSTLMQAAMRHLAETKDQNGKPRLIFPFEPRTRGKVPDLPNKFVAILDSGEEAEDAAAKAVENLRVCWDSIAQQVRDHILGKVPPFQEALPIWDRQIKFDAFFEVYWVIAEERPEKDGMDEAYGPWYERAQRALDERKRLRDFCQLSHAEMGEKSTISGEREALHGKEADLASVKKFWSKIAEVGEFSEAQISHDGSERLDAIDTIKRFATAAREIPKQPFPSTSTVAAAPFIAGLLEKAPTSQALNKALENWEHLTEGVLAEGANPGSLPYLVERAGVRRALLGRDGDCYFIETFTPKRLEENYGLPKDGQETQRLVKQAPAILSALRRTAAAPDVKMQPLSPYYAVLRMDGDHMGTLLSKVKDRDEHTEISKALSHFSRKLALPIVETGKYPAKLVYAGGDDVLALAPVCYVLDLCQQLQEAYVEAMKPSTQALCKRAEQKGESLQVTMSAGIAIAHYLDPLSHVLREARSAEEAAKERYGRNAVVVTLLRRSGEPTTVGCKWRYERLAQDNQPLALFKEIQGLLESGALSRKFVYNLAEEAAVISRLSQREPDGRSPQESEIKRLLHRGRQQESLLSDEQIASLARRLALLAKEMNPSEANGTKKPHRKTDDKSKERPDEVELWRDGPRSGLVEISGWLLLMAFALRGGVD